MRPAEHYSSVLHTDEHITAIRQGYRRIRFPADVQPGNVIRCTKRRTFYQMNGIIVYSETALHIAKESDRLSVGHKVDILNRFHSYHGTYTIKRKECCFKRSVENRLDEICKEGDFGRDLDMYIDQWNHTFPDDLWLPHLITIAYDIKVESALKRS